jgi:hypothetical protein
MPLPFVALYKDTVDHCIMWATHRDRQRGASEKSLDSVSAKGANWVGRNAIARRSASLKSPVDWDPFERPIVRSGSGRANECVRVYHDQCVRISGDGCGTPSPCRNVPVTDIPRTTFPPGARTPSSGRHCGMLARGTCLAICESVAGHQIGLLPHSAPSDLHSAMEMGVGSSLRRPFCRTKSAITD